MFILGFNKGWASSRFSVPITAAAVISSTYNESSELSRSSFPEGFVFGTGSSSYQVRFVTLCVLVCMRKYA